VGWLSEVEVDEVTVCILHFQWRDPVSVLVIGEHTTATIHVSHRLFLQLFKASYALGRAASG
jgi:hypothetical protein